MLEKYGRNNGALGTRHCPLAKADRACISCRSSRERADCKPKNRNLHNDHITHIKTNRTALPILPSQAGRNRRQISFSRQMPALQAVQPFSGSLKIPFLFLSIHSMPFAERRERLYLKGHYGCSISISTQTNLPQSSFAVCWAKAQFFKTPYPCLAAKYPK